MTGTDYTLFTHKSVPVIFEPPCINCTVLRSRLCGFIEGGRVSPRSEPQCPPSSEIHTAFILVILKIVRLTGKYVYCM